MIRDKAPQARAEDLPAQTCLPINRCNLPCHVLAGLSFQRSPQPLQLDGVHVLHHQLFDVLQREPDPRHRAVLFSHHMRAGFQLDEAPTPTIRESRPGRAKADYRQLLRGWLFNADGREGAVIKAWVESRFGLQTRYHGEPLPDRDSPAYQRYLAAQSHGLYNTNALHAQLDLLYSYCQFELQQQDREQVHRTLFRGLNKLHDTPILADAGERRRVLLLNNVSSFSTSRERADEFGDQVIRTHVPHAKLLYVPGLIPGALNGEDEHLVIGGLYEIELL